MPLDELGYPSERGIGVASKREGFEQRRSIRLCELAKRE